ncbi:uncharacterized protein LOC125528921 [Triticum urartu]|nr:uncharacterized protein LOC125528921 [Triticum urartu]
MEVLRKFVQSELRNPPTTLAPSAFVSSAAEATRRLLLSAVSSSDRLPPLTVKLLHGRLLRLGILADLYTYLLRALSSSGLHLHVLCLYSLLPNPSHLALPVALKSASRLRNPLRVGEQLHARSLKLPSDSTPRILTSLLNLYAKCGLLQHARSVLEEMPCPSTVSWTALIAAYMHAGRAREAVAVARDAFASGMRPDSFMAAQVLTACARVADLGTGEAVWRTAEREGIASSVFVATAAVDLYVKCGEMAKAREVFDRMPEKDVVAWGAMVSGYASNGRTQEALQLFFAMQAQGVRPNCRTVAGALSACTQLGAFDLAQQVVAVVDWDQLLDNPVLGTALIEMYSKFGSMGEAWFVFQQMRKRGITVWNAMVLGLSMTGHDKSVFALVGQMEKSGMKLNDITFMSLLYCCTHAGLVQDGRRYFHNMTQLYRIAPRIEHYGCMVDLLSRAGLLKEAHRLINEMPMQANVAVWGALLGGCKIHRDAELAEHALKQLILLEPWNSGNYFMLSNIYSNGGRWKDDAKLRLHMKAIGVKEVPGYSWVDFDGKVHKFHVGDNWHPLMDQIYKKLDELGMEMKAIGYKPTTDEEKEHPLVHHSMKLAVAFCLLTTSPGEAIRVIKNTRVCTDCHTDIKLISRIAHREIIVQDNSRFHCFRDGCCSCNDYWQYCMKVIGVKEVTGYSWVDVDADRQSLSTLELGNFMSSAAAAIHRVLLQGVSSSDRLPPLTVKLLHGRLLRLDLLGDLSPLLLRALSSSGLHVHALRLHSLLPLPSHLTLPCALKSASRLPNPLPVGEQLHARSLKLPSHSNPYVLTSLLNLYAKCDLVDHARSVFDEMRCPNTVSWTALITAYMNAGRVGEAVAVARDAFASGMRPDSFTVVRVLTACARVADLGTGEAVWRAAQAEGVAGSVFVATAAVDMYVKCGEMARAREVFDKMPEKDAIAWGAMVGGYASNGHPQETLELFFAMQTQGVKPDCYTVVGALSACTRLGALDMGRQAVRTMDWDEFLDNPVLGTALIDMYAKCGSTGEAWVVFQQMRKRDIVVWNAMILGLGLTGHGKIGFALVGQMEKSGMKLNDNTFISILCNCTHTGLVKDGRRYFHNMTQLYNITPRIEHYGCMVDLLSRAGLLQEARQLIDDMPMQANAVVWGALLGGCKIHRDAELAEHALKQLVMLEPRNSGNYVMLSNIYSNSNRWEDAAKLRSDMKVKRVEKVRAYSWVEFSGKVHEFRVGDKSHPHMDQIYQKLDELGMEMKTMGYKPTTDVVMFDVEDEEKEHTLVYHSEKLAIAFCLLTTQPGEVIRVTKNLRVCTDCHTAIKLISRITHREIIVRDNNRFHCFKDGCCSCNDYW